MAPWALQVTDRAARRSEYPFGALAMSGHEASFLVRELLIEGGARDARAGADAGDRDLAEPALSCDSIIAWIRRSRWAGAPWDRAPTATCGASGSYRDRPSSPSTRPPPISPRIATVAFHGGRVYSIKQSLIFPAKA